MVAEQKVINFPANTDFHDFLDQVSKDHKNKKLLDFICIYTIDSDEGPSPQIVNFWFGKQSTLSLLGLNEVMKVEILNYMMDLQDEDE